MSLQKVSIHGIMYGQKDSIFGDSELYQMTQRPTSNERKFFTILALCHTCKVDMHENERKLVSPSPDELALVSASQHFDITVLDSSSTDISISVQNQEENYEILHILKFTSERKRMSVLLRSKTSKKLMLVTKGADDVIIPRLAAHQESLCETTYSHLVDFAKAGLRTLLVAYRILSEEEATIWLQQVHHANVAIDNRTQLLAKAYETVEIGMSLLGATAIEDKLQDRVAETIAVLREAQISVWMLTGDKFETAKQIAYSCKMVQTNEDLFQIVGEDEFDVHQSIQEVRDQVNNIPLIKGKRQFCLIVNGSSLMYALRSVSHEEFKRLVLEAVSVVCCRVTPGQKAQVSV